MNVYAGGMYIYTFFMRAQGLAFMGNFAGSGRNYHFYQKMAGLPFSGNSAPYGPWARRRKVPFMGHPPASATKCQKTHGEPWVSRKGGTNNTRSGWDGNFW